MQSVSPEQETLNPRRRQTFSRWRVRTGQVFAWLLTKVLKVEQEDRAGHESAYDQAQTVKALSKLFQDAITEYRGESGNVQMQVSGEQGQAPDKLVIIAHGRNAVAQLFIAVNAIMDAWESDDLPRYL